MNGERHGREISSSLPGENDEERYGDFTELVEFEPPWCNQRQRPNPLVRFLKSETDSRGPTKRRNSHGCHRRVFTKQAQRGAGVHAPADVVAGPPSLTCANAAEIEPELRVARSGGSPRKLRGEHMVKAALLGRGRNNQQRWREGAPVREPLEHLLSHRDNRRSFEELPGGHHAQRSYRARGGLPTFVTAAHP